MKTILIATFSLPTIWVSISIFELIQEQPKYILITLFSIFSILWYILFPKHLYKKSLQRTKKMIEDGDNSGVLGLHELTFNNEGIIHIEPGSEQKIKWNGIKKVEESETHFFLFNTAVTAIIIPKEKIKSQVEQLSFLLKSNIT